MFEVKEFPLEFSTANPEKMILRVKQKNGLAAAQKLLPLLKVS